MIYLNRKQATDWLRNRGLNVGDYFLAREAVLGTGPQFRYSGRKPLYVEEDLAAWLEDGLTKPVRTPSEAGRGRGPRRRAAVDATPTRRARPYKRRSHTNELPAD
jgi:hypothetical protein